MQRVRKCLENGDYLDTFHSNLRQRERMISRMEIIQILRSGWHEKAKDRYDKHHQAWNYAVRGKTIDDRELRIIISFEGVQLLIVTAIELGV